MTEIEGLTLSAPSRRTVLAAVAAGTAAGLMRPALSFAAAAAAPRASSYPAKAFIQHSQDATLQAMFGTSSVTASADVKMDAPDIAENGAVVPVSFDANAPKVTAAAILALDNPFVMACAYKIPEGTSPAIASRIKLGKTTKVVSVVQSGGKLISASKQVKVTLGGCG
ncbi:MAG: thiosulfate oxidation carrier protein SoxY [Acidiphilium sp. 37-64-53]|uniref:thiosulfate oxidation carrier protein SoxY n=1 Tax=Acidiphilium TaxID=522 RepID=UPI000BCD25B2|nr:MULTISPECIES: thiosulfate oxidation carrier protein SoxY [Acidiphilium]OYW01094.1 MAG: thiosulfate oxidation carrier protein SoxY [Acidiphilium sp. 37-64-53]OZB28148.1 MAG: thiosulfate oxidation carrier protein SoxY [Acidiphilium sp. 34-64-41]HQT85411.1 thiosulfate oxidation carrier protein SoxY [Acidiphilium rubrum]